MTVFRHYVIRSKRRTDSQKKRNKQGEFYDHPFYLETVSKLQHRGGLEAELRGLTELRRQTGAQGDPDS